MYTVEELFKDDSGSFADVLLELGVEYERLGKIEVPALIKVFESLPEHVRNIAHCWGLSDTVFRDEAYSYLKENCKCEHLGSGRCSSKAR